MSNLELSMLVPDKLLVPDKPVCESAEQCGGFRDRSVGTPGHGRHQAKGIMIEAKDIMIGNKGIMIGLGPVPPS